MEPQAFLGWAEKIKGFSGAELLGEARTLFPLSMSSNPLNAAPAVTALALSGKGFEGFADSSAFLLSMRDGLWRNAAANQQIIMPCDGSDFDARSHFQRLSSPGQFSSALRGCLTELALGSCDLPALFGASNGNSRVSTQQHEAAFLDRVAIEFEREFGPMRNKFIPRVENPLTPVLK